MHSPEHQRRAIVAYFEIESGPDVEVEHAEKVHTESLRGGHKYDIWDVHASDGRWWVITNPTNLYSQEQFPIAVFIAVDPPPQIMLSRAKQRTSGLFTRRHPGRREAMDQYHCTPL